jgi:transposase
MPRVDDGRVLSGIIVVIKGGLRWRDAPLAYGPYKTLCNRFVRSSRMGVFSRIFAALAGEAGAPDRLIIDSTHLKAHRTAARLRERARLIAASAAPQGGLNTKLAAVCDGLGRPVILLLTEGQASDHRGAALMLPKLPPAKELIADRGDDSNPFRAALAERDITACIPSTRSRKVPIPHDATLYRQRHRIAIAVARLKDWRRIATRDDRCATILFGAITPAAIVIAWIGI